MIVLTSHMRELLGASFKVIPVLGLHGVLNGARYRVIGTEDSALRELDLTGHTTLEGAADTNSTAARLLPRTPVLDRAGFAPVVGGSNARRLAIAGRVDVAARATTVALVAVRGVCVRFLQVVGC